MIVEGTWPIGLAFFLFFYLSFYIIIILFNFGQNAQQECRLEDRLSFELETSQETGRLQIANLRPEHKLFFSFFFFFPVEGTAPPPPSSDGIPSAARLQRSLFLQPSLIAGSHSATLITSHQEKRLQRGANTLEGSPLSESSLSVGSSFPKPSSDYQCTDGIKITSYSYMNHK